MQLSEYLENRYLLEKEASDGYAYQLRYAVDWFAAILGRPPVMTDLNRDTVNRMLVALQGTKLAHRSRRNIRASILTLWTDAADAGEVNALPHRIRRVSVPEKPPEAWTFEEFARVADGLAALPGKLKNGVPRGLYFRTIHWFSYETGLRRKDCWDFDISRIDRANRVAISQHKTKRTHLVQVSAETAGDLRRICDLLKAQGDRLHGFPLRWPHSPSLFYDWFAKGRKRAGIDADTHNRALQHNRRTGATAVESARPGAATRYLGHTSGPALARKSYIDPRLVGEPETPPEQRHHAQHRQRASDTRDAG